MPPSWAISASASITGIPSRVTMSSSPGTFSMQKLRGWISHTIRMNSNTSSLRGSSGWRLPASREPLARRAAEHAADVVAGQAELVEDPLAGQCADVAEEDPRMAARRAVWRSTPTPGSSEGASRRLGVVALMSRSCRRDRYQQVARPSIGAEHVRVSGEPRLQQVGVRGVDVALVGGDHVPARLLEAAGEPAGAGEQVDPDWLALGVLEDRPARTSFSSAQSGGRCRSRSGPSRRRCRSSGSARSVIAASRWVSRFSRAGGGHRPRTARR